MYWVGWGVPLRYSTGHNCYPGDLRQSSLNCSWLWSVSIVNAFRQVYLRCFSDFSSWKMACHCTSRTFSFALFHFVLLWTIFKVSVEFVTISLRFCVLVFDHKTCGILTPQPGIEPASPHWKVDWEALPSSSLEELGKSPSSRFLNYFSSIVILNDAVFKKWCHICKGSDCWVYSNSATLLHRWDGTQMQGSCRSHSDEAHLSQLLFSPKLYLLFGLENSSPNIPPALIVCRKN